MPFVLSTSPCQFSTIDLWLPQMLTNSVNSTTACSNFCRFSFHICTNVPTHTHPHTHTRNLLTYYLCHVTDHFIGCGVATGRELDLRSVVQILLKAPLHNNLGQVVHNLVPAKGRWCSAVGDVTAGLVESNGSLPPDGWLTVTCGLTACTPGSAPGPMLGIKYGKPLPFTNRFNGPVRAVTWVCICGQHFKLNDLWPRYLASLFTLTQS